MSCAWRPGAPGAAGRGRLGHYRRARAGRPIAHSSILGLARACWLLAQIAQRVSKRARPSGRAGGAERLRLRAPSGHQMCPGCIRRFGGRQMRVCTCYSALLLLAEPAEDAEEAILAGFARPHHIGRPLQIRLSGWARARAPTRDAVRTTLAKCIHCWGWLCVQLHAGPTKRLEPERKDKQQIGFQLAGLRPRTLGRRGMRLVWQAQRGGIWMSAIRAANDDTTGQDHQAGRVESAVAQAARAT